VTGNVARHKKVNVARHKKKKEMSQDTKKYFARQQKENSKGKNQQPKTRKTTH
jgi:hypothetical protein